jgi:hypothetical protein
MRRESAPSKDAKTFTTKDTKQHVKQFLCAFVNLW